MGSAELRIFVWNHERFRDEVEVFRPFRNLKTLKIFVHPVLPRQLVTPGEMVHSLVWQHGLECLWLGMRPSPHQVEIHVVLTDFMKTVCMENLTNDLGVRLNHFKGEMVSGPGRVGGGLAQGERVEDDDGVPPLLHGGGPGDVIRLVAGPGAGEANPGLGSSLSSILLLLLLPRVHVSLSILHDEGFYVTHTLAVLFKFPFVYSFQYFPRLLVLVINPL